MNQTPELYDFLKILASVSLGMFGKSLYDFFLERIKLKRDKKFILQYFENSKESFPLLKHNYELLIELLPLNKNGLYELKLFENFNTDVLQSLSFPRYYRLFKNKSSLIFEIYNIVNSLQEDLPHKIFSQHKESMMYIANNDKSLNFEEVQNLFDRQILITKSNIEIKLREVEELKDRVNQILL